MSDVSIDLDEFGTTLSRMIDDVDHAVKEVPEPAVRKGLKKGAQEWRKGAPVDSGRYKKSIRWHVLKTGDDPAGEIGSPSLPGLPHLLEKGHARVGGGRVPGIPHIAPAAEVAFDETEKAMLEGIGEALR